MRLRKRPFLIGGGALLGGAALSVGGSLAVCAGPGPDLLSGQVLVRPLFAAIGDIPEPARIGQQYLKAFGRTALIRALSDHPDLSAIALMAGPDRRRAALAALFQREFADHDTLVVDRWVVSRSEAMVAAAWVL